MANDEASQQANRSGMDPMRLTVIFYLLAGLVVALFLHHLLGMIWAQLGWPDPMLVEIADAKLTTVLAFALAAGIAVGCWMHPVTHRLSLEVASELMKVTWPTWPETRSSTIAVVVASLVASLLLFVIDQFAFHLMVRWLPTLWGKL